MKANSGEQHTLGHLVIVAEIYNGGKYAKFADRLSQWTGMAILDVEQHEAIFSSAGFTEAQVYEEPARGWICVVGAKPL